MATSCNNKLAAMLGSEASEAWVLLWCICTLHNSLQEQMYS
jgi:hypothetical protein